MTGAFLRNLLKYWSVCNLCWWKTQTILIWCLSQFQKIVIILEPQVSIHIVVVFCCHLVLPSPWRLMQVSLAGNRSSKVNKEKSQKEKLGRVSLIMAVPILFWLLNMGDLRLLKQCIICWTDCMHYPGRFLCLYLFSLMHRRTLLIPNICLTSMDALVVSLNLAFCLSIFALRTLTPTFNLFLVL